MRVRAALLSLTVELMVGILLDKKIPNRNEVVLHVSRQMSVIGKNLAVKPFVYCSNEK